MTQTVLKATRRGFGIQTYLGRVYNYMGGGLLMSALMAWLSTKEPLFGLFYKINEFPVFGEMRVAFNMRDDRLDPYPVHQLRQIVKQTVVDTGRGKFQKQI